MIVAIVMAATIVMIVLSSPVKATYIISDPDSGIFFDNPDYDDVIKYLRYSIYTENAGMQVKAACVLFSVLDYSILFTILQSILATLFHQKVRLND